MHKYATVDWTDGPWIVAHATVDDGAPSWLKRGTRASFESRPFDRRDFRIRERRVDIVAHALVSEVSVLSPSVRPAEPRAEVLTYRPAEPKPARSATPLVKPSGRAAGEVIHGDGQLIRRPGIGQVLGVR